MKDLDEIMTMDIRKAIGDVAECILYEDCVRAIKYLSLKLTVKATRRGKKSSFASHGKIQHHEMVISLGPPELCGERIYQEGKEGGRTFPHQESTT